MQNNLNKNQDTETHFIQEKIKALKCKRFVEDKQNNCHCGRSQDKHDESDETGSWSENVFEIVPTNAYGKMQLSGYIVIAGKYPHYIRACQTKSLNDDLYTIMTKYWNFKPPELIISMNGGAKKMIPLNNDQKLAFKRGLIDVSKAAPTWIVTGGFHFGISKLVGEAAKDYSILSREQPFTVLGIGTWGAVYNRENLEINESKTKIIYNNVEGQSAGIGQASLDPYHDAFIFYDKGYERKFGLEIEFRTQFEEYVSQRAKCSVVQVIVEGGKNTIMTGAEALKAGTPIVVMKGSKRAADVICDVVESSDQMVEDIITIKLAEYKEEWNFKDDEGQQMKDHLREFHKCFKNKKVHLFNMRDFKNNLDTAIIEAAFSGTINKKPLTDDAKLRLAMTFNRADVAEERICETQTTIIFRDYINSALMKDQWQFVDFFLRQGITVESFLTKKILTNLYFNKDIHNATNYVLREVIESNKTRNLSSIGKIISQLTNALFPMMYQELQTNTSCTSCMKNTNVIDSLATFENCTATEVKDYDQYNEPIIIQNQNTCCCWSGSSEKTTKEYVYTVHPVRNKNKEIIYTEQDLFLWALLTQRIEMAKIFWKCGKDHIGSALIANVICNALKKKAKDKGEVEMMLSLQAYQDDFENMALNILSEAYRRDQIRTHLLLIRALPFWGRESCLDIANKFQQINFLFHSACQTRLNSIWLGSIPPYINILQLLINIPFGFLTSRRVIFQNVSQDNKLIDMDQAANELVVGFDKKTEIENQLGPFTSKTFQVPNEPITRDETTRVAFLTRFRMKQKISVNEMDLCTAMKFFYKAPITKFIMNIITYLVFLTIFSYVQIVELNSLANSPFPANRQMEYVVYVFFISFLLGEFRQFFMGGQKNNLRSKFDNWKSSMWNWFDLVIYIIFIIAFILRCISTVDIVYCRTLYAISLSMFFIRFMEFYYVQQSVGPQVIMISRMMKDLLFFLAIYLIALLAYGTFSLSLLYSNVPLNSTLLKNIFYNPFWQLFGQVDTNYMEGSYCLYGQCATPNAIVIVANAIFLLFSNVLLLSLLIAMFGVTFTKVEENSNRVWAFTRYRMIEEFYYRPILPPPFNVFEIFYHFFELWKCKQKNVGVLSVDEFIVNLSHDEDIECSGFEQQCMETYIIGNPLFTDAAIPNDRKTAISTTNADISSLEKYQANTLESHILSLLNTVNDMNKEIKDLSGKVYKIRRSQKKNIVSHRMTLE